MTLNGAKREKSSIHIHHCRTHTYYLTIQFLLSIIVMTSEMLQCSPFTSISLRKLTGFVSGEGKSKWYIYSVPHSAECQEHSSVPPHRPHYPLNFQLFQRQMSTPGIQAKPVNDEHWRLCHPHFSHWR